MGTAQQPEKTAKNGETVLNGPDMAVEIFRQGVQSGFQMAAAIVESSCRHRFFCHCKQIAADLRKTEVEASAVQEVESGIKWDDVIGGE